MATNLDDSSGLVKGQVPLPGGSTAIYNASGLSYIRHTDWLGSSRLATTWAHAVYSKEAYAPFGETYNEAGTADRSFTGQDQDVVTGSGGTGVYDYLFRKYDPSAGRWLSPDPAGWNSANPADPQSLNRYAYVENNPLSATDLNGLMLCVSSDGSTLHDFGDSDCGDGWTPYQAQGDTVSVNGGEGGCSPADIYCQVLLARLFGPTGIFSSPNASGNCLPLNVGGQAEVDAMQQMDKALAKLGLNNPAVGYGVGVMGGVGGGKGFGMNGSINVQIVTAIDGTSGVVMSFTAPTPTGAFGPATQGAAILGGAQFSVTENVPTFSSLSLSTGYDTSGILADGVGIGLDIDASDQPTENLTLGFGFGALAAGGVTTITDPLVQACPAMVPMQ